MFAIGDKVVRIGVSHPEAPKGCVASVNDVWEVDGETALALSIEPLGDFYGWKADGWRKIQPCEPEFMELLNRIKPKVDA